MFVQPGRLHEQVLALLGVRGQQAAYVILHRVDAHGRPHLEKILLGGYAARVQLPQRLPSQARFDLLQFLQRAQFAEQRALAGLFQIEHARGDAQRSFGRRAALGRQQFVVSVDHAGRVQRVTHLDDGGVRQLGARPQRKPAVGLRPGFAAQHQQPFGGKRILHGFRDALADPIQARRIGVVEEPQHHHRFGSQRRANDYRQPQQSKHSVSV